MEAVETTASVVLDAQANVEEILLVVALLCRSSVESFAVLG